MNKPLIWAHRGASGYMPENTLIAFQKAVELHADGVELDIQMTKDNQIVVCHDETIDRTSDGTGFLKDYTLEELRQFNFNKTHPEVAHAPIPTMKEVFGMLKHTDLTINIELKTGVFYYEGIEEAIVKMTHEMEMQDRVIYSSFNHYSVMRIKELDPDAKIAFLSEDGMLDMPEYGKKHGVNALHPWFGNIRYPDFMKKAHEYGLDVNVWTVNDPEYMNMCADAGVHAIITNVPDQVRQVLHQTEISEQYNAMMNDEIKPWLSAHVESRDINSQDGTRLRLYEAKNPDAKASILMVHGFCEFFGKHYENAWRFYNAGYSVYFLELRGHGDSQHNPAYDDMRVGVDSFQDYVDDLQAAVDYIHSVTDDQLYLFAHFMGGLVSALYLEEHHDVFRCAALSSPMIKMSYGFVPDRVVGFMKVYSDAVGNDDDYAPGQGPFTGIANLEGSSAMDPDRYQFQFNMRCENEQYQTWGGTWGWVKASRAASALCLENAAEAETPILILQAGADTMVDNEGQNEFCQRAQNTSLITYSGSRHELYNATADIRQKWMDDILSFYHLFDLKK